ncbi:flagellar hook-associated protein FlgK [Shumkonia mesophila]|uniref:flagellar hook-associated protein FlgK n=1 Tax=Shumkonia mesophila TaxID=2838854 RepID=UPI002934747E|nr:flagellar hook-associated protein FlgK [Shumkonia mesophila]
MSGTITLALRTAQSGLLVNQQALGAISDNIANVNSPGYSRKIVNIEQRVVGGAGAGVQLSELTRVIDEGLVKSLRLETGTYQRLRSQQTYYARIQETFGSPNDNTSISHILNTFVSSIETLAVSPDKTLELSELVRQGQEVALKLQSMSETIQELRVQADAEIAADVREVNNLTAKIADLNDKIIRNKTVTNDVSDLRDQRDQALDELSGLVDIRYFYRGDGDVVVFSSAGRTLVDNVAFEFSHSPASSVTPTTTHAEGDLGGIYLGAPVPGNDVTDELVGGSLGGLVEMRDTILTDMQSQIDELAATLRDTVNQIHNRGATFPGLQSMTGSREFLNTADAANAVNQTIKLDPTGSVDDVAIVLVDGDGNQSAATTLNTIMTGAGFSSRGAGNDWAIADVASTMETWLQANGAAGAKVAVDGTGHFAIELNSTSLNLAFRDQAATANGSALEDAEIGFDADGNGTVDETVKGFANFFGLNDFFVDNAGRNIHESDVMSAGFKSSATTLRFVDGTSTLPLDPGGAGDMTVAIPAGSTLAQIAAAINTNVPNVTASVVPDGSGYRLRIAHDDGRDFAVTETGAGGLLSTLDVHNADVRVAGQIAVRGDIRNSPSLVSRGTVQWDANLGSAGEYYTSVGDDSAIKALAARMSAVNSFDAAGGLGSLQVNFADYGASILGRSASLADNNETDANSQQALTESLQNKSDNIRGVNLDEEMADLIRFEQAYSAAARLIGVIQNMFDALDQAVG